MSYPYTEDDIVTYQNNMIIYVWDRKETIMPEKQTESLKRTSALQANLAPRAGLELYDLEEHHQPLSRSIPCCIAFLLGRLINGSLIEARRAAFMNGNSVIRNGHCRRTRLVKIFCRVIIGHTL